MTIQMIYWLLVLFLAYTYAGYPLILWGLARTRKKRIHRSSFEPYVSLLISVFNEEKFLREKVENLLDLDYPKEKLEILIGSDGAIDGSDSRLSEFQTPRLRVYKFVRRLGKPSILNHLVREARGEILVFSDARQLLAKNALRELLANFADPSVGCVSGELHLAARKPSLIGSGAKRYWDYEKAIRQWESATGSVIGATGAFYAIPKKLFQPMPADTILDDLYLPLAILIQGKRILFETRAKVYDEVSRISNQEFERKTRTLAGNFQCLFRSPGLWEKMRLENAWRIFSHKILRLLAPYFLISLFMVNGWIWEGEGPWFYTATWWMQVLFYSLALIGFLSERRRWKFFLPASIPYSFVVLNAAAVAGLIRYLRRKQSVTWKKAYVSV